MPATAGVWLAYKDRLDIDLSAEAEIRRRILASGPITFAEFMELALYWTEGGYYLGRDPVGAVGDYYTSPAVHPAFGALLAVQIYQMWLLLERPSRFTVAELGAGSGLLCRDIVSFAAHLPGSFRESLDYVCLDRRATPSIGLPGVTRVTAEGVPLRQLTGCVLSNEYLDAFPVHQAVMTETGLREVFVGLEGDTLVEIQQPPSTPALASRFEALGIRLEPGQTAEVNLGLDRWASEVAAALDRGFVLTVDYGHPAQELYSAARRRRGTLVTYYQHLQTDAPLTRIGRQDITAQVDFTSVARAGAAAGMDTLGMASQAEFLSNLNLAHFQRHLRTQSISARDLRANQAGMTELVKPDGLGGFKVLAQGKGVDRPDLWGFAPTAETAELFAGLSAPLLTANHLSLSRGRYPEYEIELDALWPDEPPEF